MEIKAQIVEGIRYKPILKCDLTEVLIENFQLRESYQWRRQKCIFVSRPAIFFGDKFRTVWQKRKFTQNFRPRPICRNFEEMSAQMASDV